MAHCGLPHVDRVNDGLAFAPGMWQKGGQIRRPSRSGPSDNSMDTPNQISDASHFDAIVSGERGAQAHLRAQRRAALCPRRIC